MYTYIVVISIVFLLFIFQSRIKFTLFGNSLNISLLPLIPFPVLMLYTINNPDYQVYRVAYETGYGPYFETGIKIISDGLRFLGLYDYSVFLCLVVLFVYLVFYKWGKLCPEISYVILLYTLFVMFYDVIQIRNTIASFLILLGLYFCVKQKILATLLSCVVAIFFHRLSLLTGVLLIYLFFTRPNKYLKPSKLELTSIIFFSLVGVVFGGYIVQLLSFRFSFFERLSLYLSSKVGLDSLIIWGGYSLFSLILLWFFGVKKILSNSERKGKFTEEVIAISLLFRYSLFSIPFLGFLLYIDEFNRVYKLFYIINYLLFSFVKKELSNSNGIILSCIFCILNIIFMLVTISRGINFDLYW